MAEQETLQSIIQEEVSNLGLSDNYVPALLASAGAESTSETAIALQESQSLDDYLSSTVGGKGFGLFQFDVATKNGYAEWVKSNNLDPLNPRSQVRFALLDSTGNLPKELNGGSFFGIGNAKKLDKIVQEADTPEQAALVYREGYIRPNTFDDEEQERTLSFLDNMTSPASVTKEEPVVEAGTTDTEEPVYKEDYRVVSKGDTLSKIAEQSNMTLAELLAQNPTIENPDLIEPGQEIYTAPRSFMSPVGDLVQKGTSYLTGGEGTRLGMNEGGMAKQMELFDEGGLLQEGGSVDPFSGNDVPVGSTQEEVRDDIPAQLSEGEFVFPADVVRYHGLEKLMELRQEAKQGLQMMDDMGQMGNSEEAIMPDNLPFDINDLMVEDDGVQEFNVGGMPQGTSQVQSSMTATPTGIVPQSGAGQFTQLQTTSPYAIQGAPTGQPAGTATASELLPSQETDLRQYSNEQGQILSIPFVNGQPLYPIPAGYSPYTEEAATPAAPPVATAPPAPVQQSDGGNDDQRYDSFGQGATTVFGGTVQDGLIKGGTTYEVGYDKSGLGGGLQVPGLLGLVTGGYDQVTITDQGGRSTTMSKDLYNTLKENRTSSETTSILNNMFNKSEAARSAVESDPQFKEGFLGTGFGSNRKELDSKMARQLVTDSGLKYNGQSLAEAMMLSDEVIAKAGRPTVEPTVEPTQQFAPSGTPFGAGAQAPYMDTIPGGTRPEVTLTTTSPRGEVNMDGTGQMGLLSDTRRATEGDVARLSGIGVDVKVGQPLTPTEVGLSDERTMQRVDAPTFPVTRMADVSTINRFGKLTDYEKVGDDYFRVKDDGTLASAPATGLTAANLKNPDSPIVSRATVEKDTGKRMAMPIPRPDREERDEPSVTPAPFRTEMDTVADAREVRKAEEAAQAAAQARAGELREAQPTRTESAQARYDAQASSYRAQGYSPEAAAQAGKNKVQADDEARTQTGNVKATAVTDSKGNAVRSSSGSVVTNTPPQNDSGGDSSGDKIVCTEMYRQTELADWSKAMKIWGAYEKKYLTPYHEIGYHWLFKPYVRGMQNSTMLTKLGAYLASERTKHLKHVMTKGRAKDSLVGNLWCKVIHPIVYVAGRIKNG